MTSRDGGSRREVPSTKASPAVVGAGGHLLPLLSEERHL